MTSSQYILEQSIKDFPLWNRLKEKQIPISFDLEITARCNNNCKHCYINLPANNRKAASDELSVEEIASIAEQAKDLGILWCLITGGEPLLRDDFAEIYTILKKKGFFLSIFTNACLVNRDHIKLFTKYPPRDIEVTVYGATKETYEQITRRPGSYQAFRKGLNLLLENNIKVRLKAMALRSNFHEFKEISEFCKKHSKDYFRFDPLLHLRFDRNPDRNKEILLERLTASEIVALEQADPDRVSTLIKKCDELIRPSTDNFGNILFKCGAGTFSFNVSYNGIFRPCSSLWHPEFTYDLTKGTLAEALQSIIPRIRAMKSNKPEFLEKCNACELVNLCLWCPAHVYLETGELDGWCSYFCAIAHARAEYIRNASNQPSGP